MTDFRLQIETRKLVKRIYNIKYPPDEKYGLQSQIRRASVSISLNLAEGNNFKNKNKSRFFQISLNSGYEVRECLILTKELFNIQIEEELGMLDSITAQLFSVIRNLKSEI